VSNVDRPTPEYPPAELALNRKFKAPGPVSRQLANYFAMCAPSSRRRARLAHRA